MVDASSSSFLSLSPELGGALAKVAVFVVVQALVYLILRSSSDLFSKDGGRLRSLGSFRPMRSMSVRRVLAQLSDVPVGTDDASPSPSPSPSSMSMMSPAASSPSSRRRVAREDSNNGRHF